MKVRLTDKATKQYLALPIQLQKKADKQFTYLVQDFKHPSLHIKKLKGDINVWQARIDKGWRFYFHIIEPHYIIISIINHPR